MANRSYIFNSDAVRQLHGKNLDTYYQNHRDHYRDLAKDIHDDLAVELDGGTPLRGDVFSILSARLEASPLFLDALEEHDVSLNTSYAKWFAFFAGLIINEDWAYIIGLAGNQGGAG